METFPEPYTCPFHQESLIIGFNSLGTCIPSEASRHASSSCWDVKYPLEKDAAAAKSLQSCLTLYDPIDGSLLGSPVPGILQAMTLEWVAISFSNA